MLDTLNTLTFFDMTGILGVLLYLGSYAILQMGLISGRGYIYPGMNAAAASCVIVSLLQDYNLSSLLIQISFIVISAYGMTRIFINRNMRGFTADEEAFMQHAIPTIDREFSGQLAKMGVWHQVSPREVLMEEGKQVQDLIYLADGKADVTLNSIDIASVNQRSLLGEVTCLEGQPATATVVTSSPSRIMKINAEKLRSKMQANPEFRSQLEHCIKLGIASKLAKSNREVMLNKAINSKPKKRTVKRRTKPGVSKKALLI